MSGPEPPLSEAEIRAWLDGLAPTDTKRAEVLRDLLRHAGQDHMSSEDRAICARCMIHLRWKLKQGASKLDVNGNFMEEP